MDNGDDEMMPRLRPGPGLWRVKDNAMMRDQTPKTSLYPFIASSLHRFINIFQASGFYSSPASLCFAAISSARRSMALNVSSVGAPLVTTGSMISALISFTRPESTGTDRSAQP